MQSEGKVEGKVEEQTQLGFELTKEFVKTIKEFTKEHGMEQWSARDGVTVVLFACAQLVYSIAIKMNAKPTELALELTKIINKMEELG